MARRPSANGSNGRTAGGRFAPGNAGGPGNPHAKQTAQLRAALLDAVTPEDVRAISIKLVEMAKGGDLAAIRELLDRLLGRPSQACELIVTEMEDCDLDQQIEHELQRLADQRQAEAFIAAGDVEQPRAEAY